MKTTMFSLFILSLFLTGANQKYDCKPFHTGTFRYVSDKLNYVIVERNDTVQVETDTHSGYSITAKVAWLSDCQYKLTYQKITDPALKRLIGFTIITNIVKVSGDTITCRSVSSHKKGEIKMIKQ